MLTVMVKSKMAPASTWYVLLTMVRVYTLSVCVTGALERLATASGTTVPVGVIWLTVPVITVPVPVLDEAERYRVKVRGPVNVTFPARTGWV